MAARPPINRMKKKVFAEATTIERTSHWTLVQNDDRTLYVKQEAEFSDGARKQRTVSINDFMMEGGPPPRELQKLLDALFADN